MRCQSSVDHLPFRAPAQLRRSGLVDLWDYGLEPVIAQEARELQTAVGMVAAEEGICIVPESARKSRREDVAYLDVLEPICSPIIMSHRIADNSVGIAVMAAVISQTYRDWGYTSPDALDQLASASDWLNSASPIAAM